MDIAEIRQLYPEQTSKLSDADIINRMAQAAGQPVDYVAGRLGVQRNQPGFWSAARSGVASYATGLGRAMEDMGAESAGGGLRRYGEDVQFRNPTTIHSFSDFANDPWQGVKEFTGQALGSTGPALIPYVGQAGKAGALLGTAGRLAAGTAISSVPAYGEIRSKQDQEGIDNPWAAAGGALATGAVEQAGGIQRVLRPGSAARFATDFARSPMRTAAKAGLRTMAEEGAEELVQSPIQQYAGGQNPLAPEQLQETAFSGFAGAVGSLGFGAFGGARAGLQHRQYNQAWDAEQAERSSRIAAQLDAQQPVDLLNPNVGPDNGQLFDQPINPYDLGGYVSAFQSGGDTTIDAPQYGLFGGGGSESMPGAYGVEAPTPTVVRGEPLQAYPHSSSGAMPEGIEPESPVERAAAIVRAAAQVNKNDRNDQFNSDIAWAVQTLKENLTEQQYVNFMKDVAAQRDTKARTKSKTTGVSQQPNATQAASTAPYADLYRKINPGFQPDKKLKYSPYIRKLSDFKTDEDALNFIRDKLINSTEIGKATAMTLEEMHKQLTGKTVAQWQNEQENQSDTGSQNVHPGQQKAQGAKPVQQIQAEGPAQGERAGVQNDQDEAVQVEAGARPWGDGNAMEWVFGEMQKRNPEQSMVLQMATGRWDGNAYNSKEIAAELTKQGRNISDSRVRQMLRDAQGTFESIVKTNKITPEELRDTTEQETATEDQLQGREGEEDLTPKTSDETTVEDVVERTNGEEDSGPSYGTGYTVDSINKVNEDRSVQAEDKDQTNAAEAAESNDPDKVAPVVWDAHVHNLAAQGQKERGWAELGKTPKGRETRKAWLEFFRKVQTSPAKDAATNARFNKTVKSGDYYSEGIPISWADLGDSQSGFMRAFLELDEAGLLNVLDAVNGVYLESVESMGSRDGYVRRGDNGALTVHLNAELLAEKGEVWTAHLLRHELAHVLDFMGGAGNEYSATSEFDQAYIELQRYHAKTDSVLSRYLDYPFGPKYTKYPEFRLRAEAFAQMYGLWMQSVGFDGRGLIQRELPSVAAFLRKVDADAKTRVLSKSENLSGMEEAAQNRDQRTDGVDAADRGANQEFESRGAAIESYPEELQATPKLITNIVTDTLNNWAKKGLQAVAFGHDLENIAVKEGLTTAKKFFDVLSTKSATRTTLEAQVDSILEQAAGLTDRKAVNAFLKMSTSKQVWGYKPTWKDDVEVDPVAEAAYNRLSEEGRKTVDAVFKHGEEIYATVQDLLNKEITAEYDRLAAAAKTDGERQKIERDRARKLRVMGRKLPKIQGPYAPLGRFGDYVVIGKSQAYIDAEKAKDTKQLETLQADPAHYVVEFYDNYYQAKARSRELQPHFAYADGFEKQKAYRELQEVPWSSISKIKNAIEDTAASDQAKTAMNRLVTDLYLTLMVESSARKSELRRKNVAGAERDMLRSFASQGRAMSHFVAALQHSPEVSAQINSMQNEARDGEQGDRDSRTRVLNEILARYAQGLDFRPTPIADKAMRMTSFWMLVTSPGYYVQNSLQTAMLTLPMLNARFGTSSSWKALYQAYKDVGRHIRQNFTGHSVDIEKLDLIESEKAILRRLRDNGRLDITIGQDLGRWSEGESITDKGVFGKVMRQIWAMPQRLEMINRVTTALAAHRLGGNFDYVANLIDQTHGNYAASNAPRFMQGTGLRKLVFQFRKYQLIQASLIAKLAYNSFANSSPEEKAVARSALKWLLTHHMVMAGALGLPAANLVGMTLAAIGGDDNEPKDAERMLRKAIGDEDASQLLLRGVPAVSGLDLSSRIGMQNAFAILPFVDLNKMDRSGYEKVLTGAAGAFLGGLLPRWADAVGMISKGDYYKGIEQMLPKGFMDMAKAYRMGTEGVTQRNNDVAMKPDELSVFDVMTQAIGLPSSTLTDRQRRYGDVIEMQNYYKDRTAEIRHRYAKAYRENDTEEMRDLRDEWSDVTAAMQRNGLKPTPLSSLVKAPMNQNKREANIVGGIPTTAGNRRFVEMNANL